MISLTFSTYTFFIDCKYQGSNLSKDKPAPPLLVIHGGRDMLVPFNLTEYFKVHSIISFQNSVNAGNQDYFDVRERIRTLMSKV